MKNLSRLGTSAALLAFAGASQAITFANFQINGSAAPPGNPTLFGTSGLSWALPSHFLIGAGTSTITLDYDVFASSGMNLDGFTVIPVGVAKNGTVSVVNSHINGGTQVHTYTRTAGPSTITLDDESYTLLPNTSFHVTAVISLIGLQSGTNSINKLTIYNVTYRESPVPEPASMAALLLGGGFILARRRKNK